ncbi:hypothetical protein [Mitsuokella sp.]|uniref:hypothetical protein n=1 Tax=Mitsuokella sp. TaxID=2049034 RepID=UPI003D7CC349
MGIVDNFMRIYRVIHGLIHIIHRFYRDKSKILTTVCTRGCIYYSRKKKEKCIGMKISTAVDFFVDKKFTGY